MSFVNKIKGWGQKGSAPAQEEDDAAFGDAFSNGGSAAMATTDLPLADVESAAAFDVPSSVANESREAGSIISEAVPSEIADFTETRLQSGDTAAAPLGAGLPMIGKRPVGESPPQARP
jgi:twitching motility protein PilJ